MPAAMLAAMPFFDSFPNPLPLLLPYLLPFLCALSTYLILRAFRLKSRLRALNNQHVWIIGASRGIGRAAALQFAHHGAIVSISSRDSASLKSLAAQLGSHLAAVVPLDVTAPLPVLQQALQSVQSIAPLDIVVFNAGINQANLPFLHLGHSRIDDIIDTNFRAVAHLFRLALPSIEQRAGVLCAVSSLAAYRGVPGGSVYGATKSALTAMCQALAVEMYASKASVVCVHPGFVDTSAIRNLQHPKPLLMTEVQAATHLINAIVLRTSHYGFPWLMQNVLLPFSTSLPTPLYNFIMYHLS